MPHGREHALDRVRRTEVVPVLGREVVEGEQRLAVLGQAGDGAIVLRRVLGLEGRERRLGGRPVGRQPDLAQGRPCARRPRSHRPGCVRPSLLASRATRGGPARVGRVHRAPGADRAGERGRAPAAGGRARAALRGADPVRDGVRAFDATGVAALTAGSSRPGGAAPGPGAAERERPRAILRRPPRAFGHARSAWTLALPAEVAYAEGLGPTELSAGTVRRALPRPGRSAGGAPSAGRPARIPPTRKRTPA